MEDFKPDQQKTKTKVKPAREKDAWDKFKILGSMLLPLALIYIGHTFTHSQKESENKLIQIQLEVQEKFAEINSRVGQAALISNFFDALVSEEPVRKKLAINAVLYALKDDGPAFVKIVIESEESPEIRDYAQNTLDTKREELLKSLFSSSKEERVNAYNDIVSGWKNDPKMVHLIAEYGTANLTNKNGVYNALVTLLQMGKGTLMPYKDELITFSNKAEANGELTKELSVKLKTILE